MRLSETEGNRDADLNTFLTILARFLVLRAGSGHQEYRNVDAAVSPPDDVSLRGDPLTTSDLKDHMEACSTEQEDLES